MAEIAASAALVLVEIVSGIIDKEVRLKKKLKGDIEDVRGLLGTIQASLKETEGKEGGFLQKDREKKLRDMAYDIEDVLDEFLLQVSPQNSSNIVSAMAREAAHFVTNRIALHRLSSSIKDIKTKKENLLGFDPRLPLQEGSSSNSMVEDHSTYQVPEEDEVAGFEKEKEELKQQLQREAGCKIISVVGPAGSGKSILVKSVYKEKSVLGRYDCHAWLYLSPSFKIDEVLTRTLEQFCEELEEQQLFTHKIDVREKLRSLLQQRRYLLVLDNLWRKEHWDRIVSELLPSGDRGGSIVITTRNSDVVSSCAPSELHVLETKPLSWPYGWRLFCKKAFPGDERCPKELMEYSQSILTKCEGLPFAIVAVGSLLSTTRRTPYEFHKFLNSLGSEIAPGSSLSRIEKVLLPSYKDLSSNLKSCFLYFCIFPEDHSIRPGRLIRLWIAEGFIKEKRGKTREMVAEEYLNELIGRNLVLVSTRDSIGRVTTCRVLNLFREFLIEKSYEENFVKILAEQGTGSSEEVRVRRLSIQNGWPQKEDLVLSNVRALFLFQRYVSLNSKIKELLRQFKLLKVLDLEGSLLESFPEEIFQLTLLRYLSLRETKIKTVPISIKKLVLLETLNLKQTNVTKLPCEVYSLKFLRHLLVYHYNVNNYVTFNSAQGVKFPAGISNLRKLQKLSLLSANSEVMKQLGALTCLTKLGLIDLKKEDGQKLCASIMKMEYLLTLDVRSTVLEEFLDLDHMANDSPRFLQRLFLKGRLEKLPRWISSSSRDSLVRIHLKWSKLNSYNNPLEALGALPNLLELQMVDSYMGESLEFGANSFEKLKILHLEQFAWLNMVVVQVNAMPKLEKLTLCKCDKLEMLPLGISGLKHLEELRLYDMNERFLDRLKEDRKGHQIDQIKIIQSFTLGSNQFFSFQNLS